MARISIGSTLLGQYRVVDLIATGGMGAVYKVWDHKRNAYLAMKVMHDTMADDPTMFAFFLREAKTLEELAHTHIVRFYGLHRTEDLTFILEEYIDGPSLKDILKHSPGKRLSVNEALIYLKALCAALGYAHDPGPEKQGKVHCDVKPGNVMVNQVGNIYLADFGIVRHADSTTTTMAGAGTPEYMAPEQILEKPVSPATDIYALGVLLFRMLTGEVPFPGNEGGAEASGGQTRTALIYAGHLKAAPPNPCALNPQIPLALGRVILQALEKEPARRPATTGAFFEAACAAVGVAPQQVPDRVALPARFREEERRPPPPPPPPGLAPLTKPGPVGPGNLQSQPQIRKGVLFSLLGGLVVVIAIAGYILWPKDPGGGLQATLNALAYFATQTAEAGNAPVITAEPSTAPPVVPPTEAPPPTTEAPPPTTEAPPPSDTPEPAPVAQINWDLIEAVLPDEEIVYVTLSLDRSGRSHILVASDNNRKDLEYLGYITASGSNFSSPVEVGGAGYGYFNPVVWAVGSQEALYAAIYNRQEKEIKLLRRAGLSGSGASWDPERSWNIGEQTAIEISPYPVVDPNSGNIYVFYYNTMNHAVEYLGSASSRANWVGRAGSFGGGVAAAMSGDGYFHVSFYDDGLVYYNFRPGEPSGYAQTLDSGYETGLAPAMGLDFGGGVHIVYYDGGSREIKYITGSGSHWGSPESIAAPVVLGSETLKISMVVNSQDSRIHLCYYDVRAHRFQYLSGWSGDWAAPQTLPGAAAREDRYNFCSIALDQNGSPHIAYSMDMKLYYARP